MPVSILRQPWSAFVAAALSLSVILAGCGRAASAPGEGNSVQPSSPPTIDPERELLITDLSVIEDPTRTIWQPDPRGDTSAWTLGRLMQNMAGAQDVSDFVLSWLRTWETNQLVNGYSVAARPSIRALVIDPWRQASSCPTGNTPCALNFARAPFRLLAIVNRPDLRTFTESSGGNAGQGRFVFGVLDPSGARLQFTVIFEYALLANQWQDVTGWATRWHDLGRDSFGENYNKELRKITDDFSGPGIADNRPNGSALLQLRTDEVALSTASPRLWELREFNISASSGLLELVTVKRTPDISLNNTATLASYLNSDADNILRGRGNVPQQLVGGSAPNPGSFQPSPQDFVWRAPGVPENVRHQFAMNTCNGCHLSETGTRFTHVKPRNGGVQTTLSDFLRLTAIPARVNDMTGLLKGDEDPPDRPHHEE